MKITAPGYSLSWEDGALVAVDQRELPHNVRVLRIADVDELIAAIRSLAIRGAPAIGIAGAFGVVIATRAHSTAAGVDLAAVSRDAERITRARPTAVNLGWGVRRALRRAPDGWRAVLDEAQAILAEDAAVNRKAAEHAADAVIRRCPDRPLRVLTHCNTGHLATAAFGTALGAIRVLAERGRLENVLVDETRPLLQGARLTTWELKEAGIPHRLAVDSAAAWAMARGEVDCVLVGADRIAVNGDVANKIGTYSLALAARHHGVPFVVVAPESTRDPDIAHGRDIVVEQRGVEEVVRFGGQRVAPEDTNVFNPAFDVTPSYLISAVVTERGAIPLQHDLAERVAASTTVYQDFPRPGVDFRDLAGLYVDAGLFEEAVAALARQFAREADRVLAIDARGFIVGTALARELKLPFTLARKAGKLPGATVHAAYSLEYGESTLHLQEGVIARGERVLVVDDILATGGTLGAAAELVRGQGGTVAGFAVVAVLTGLGGRDRLGPHKLVCLTELPAGSDTPAPGTTDRGATAVQAGSPVSRPHPGPAPHLEGSPE
jgi:methylthioribose-1-phosphate isomerase